MVIKVSPFNNEVLNLLVDLRNGVWKGCSEDILAIERVEIEKSLSRELDSPLWDIMVASITQ